MKIYQEIHKKVEELHDQMNKLLLTIQLEYRYILEHPKLVEANQAEDESDEPPPSLDKVEQPSVIEMEGAKAFLQILDNTKRIVRQYATQEGKVNPEVIEPLSEITLLSTGLLALRCPELSHQLSEIHHMAKDQALHVRLGNSPFMLM